MEKQHRGINNPESKKIEIEEGQRKPLCCNKGYSRCPSLIYNYIESQDKLNKAFDTLFRELFGDNLI